MLFVAFIAPIISPIVAFLTPIAGFLFCCKIIYDVFRFFYPKKKDHSKVGTPNDLNSEDAKS